MSWVDVAILVIFIISMIAGLVRGFTRELLSILIWVVAIWAALSFAGPLAAYLPQRLDSTTLSFGGDQITLHNLRVGIAFFLLLVAVLIVGGLVGVRLRRLAQSEALSSADRVLGMLFGMLRGAVVVVLLAMVARLTDVPVGPDWRQARLLEPFDRTAVRVIQLLPPRFARRFAVKA